MKHAKVTLRGMAPLLQVFDMPVSLKFYRDVLGFNVEQSFGDSDDVDWVLLQHDDIELMLNTTYEKDSRPSAPDPGRAAGHGDTTLYFGCPDVDSTYEYLKVKGIDVEKPQITGYGWRAITFLDPDGYQICFHWPVNERS